MKAYLILEDGTVFEGEHIGAEKEVISEIVFNTSMAGYPEVLTDPSYAGQAVCMTYPLIGNYGVCRADLESGRAWPDAFIVREMSRVASNFRCDVTLPEYLAEQGIPGLQGIDTRALTRILRERGTMNGCITTKEYKGAELEKLLKRVKAYTCGRVVDKVTCDKAYEVKGADALPDSTAFMTVNELNGKGLKIALLDFGTKSNIARSLAARGCDVTVYPAHTPASEILSGGYDGIMLSNGPGDPKENTEIIAEVKKLYESDVTIFAICLGHQLMALATGADTHKLKYGHRGGNHPVKDLDTGKVYISSQNHGYVVDTDALNANVAVPAFVNVNDGTNEGLKYTGKNIFTVQFHPESCPGPRDSGDLFDKFIGMIKEAKNA